MQKQFDWYGSKDYTWLSTFTREECDAIHNQWPQFVQKEYR